CRQVRTRCRNACDVIRPRPLAAVSRKRGVRNDRHAVVTNLYECIDPKLVFIRVLNCVCAHALPCHAVAVVTLAVCILVVAAVVEVVFARRHAEDDSQTVSPEAVNREVCVWRMRLSETTTLHLARQTGRERAE